MKFKIKGKMQKIMFNDKYGLTRAVLEGRKTMTRRVIDAKAEKWERFRHGDDTSNWDSPYQIIEKIAIAQSYKDVIEEWSKGYGIGFSFGLEDRAGMSNKMFVKSEYMPHHIEMLNYHVEHLQDISDEDCLKEGVEEHLKGVQYGFPSNIGYYGQYPFSTPREAFAALIDKVSGKGTWDSNPLVWVYSFKLID